MSLDDLRIAILIGELPALRSYLNAGGYPSEQVYDPDLGKSVPLIFLAATAQSANFEMAELLLRAGADVYSLDFSSGYASAKRRTIVQYCREIEKPQLADFVEDLAPKLGPRWHRDAIARKVLLLRIYYDKANGLQINPNDWPRPVLFGGDYDGAYPMNAADALEEAKRYRFQGAFGELLAKARPVLQRMATGEDISLNELIKLAPAGVRYQ